MKKKYITCSRTWTSSRLEQEMRVHRSATNHRLDALENTQNKNKTKSFCFYSKFRFQFMKKLVRIFWSNLT